MTLNLSQALYGMVCLLGAGVVAWALRGRKWLAVLASGLLILKLLLTVVPALQQVWMHAVVIPVLAMVAVFPPRRLPRV